VESLLNHAEVSSLETGVRVRKGHNFGSHRWISFKILQEFPYIVFLGVDVESLLGDAEVSSPATRVAVRKGHNFGSDRWISLKIYRSFWMPFS
jgi:hypothetical protein